jgi:predicted TIM-barrel fold metal-dependent hydrolase
MVIDVNVHPAFYELINQDSEREEMRHDLLNLHNNGTASLQHVFNQMSCAGIDRMFLLGEDLSGSEGRVVVSNEEISKLVKAASDRFIGIASVDPASENASENLERAFTELDLKGLWLNPAHQHFNPSSDSLEDIYQICEHYDRPIMFQSGLCMQKNSFSRYSSPLLLEEVAASHPKLRMCITGFGWPWVRETAMLLLKYPNLYADTGALFFDCAQEFYEQTFVKDIPLTWIDRSLRHQVMFGSDNPRFEQIRMADALRHLGLRDSSLQLIMGDNAMEFLGSEN